MKKYYNFETVSSKIKDGLRSFLKINKICYELSGCGSGWHFEIYCNNNEAEKVNTYLNKI